MSEQLQEMEEKEKQLWEAFRKRKKECEVELDILQSQWNDAYKAVKKMKDEESIESEVKRRLEQKS